MTKNVKECEIPGLKEYPIMKNRPTSIQYRPIYGIFFVGGNKVYFGNNGIVLGTLQSPVTQINSTFKGNI